MGCFKSLSGYVWLRVRGTLTQGQSRRIVVLKDKCEQTEIL